MLTRILSKLFTGLVIIFMMISCTNGPSVTTDYPPELPSPVSMKMNFAELAEQQSTVKAKQGSFNNFTRAAFTAGIMKTIIDVNLIIPRILLNAASDSEAQINGKGNWEWSYRAFVDGNSYTVRLVALSAEDNSTEWKFYVSNSKLGLKDHIAFSGITNANGSRGSWTYYNLQSPNTKEKISSIRWSVSNEKVNIRLEVVTDRFERAGDYIDYTFNGTLKTAVYYDAGKEQTTEVQWNTETHIGYIFSPNYNKGQQACWNGQLADTACSEL